VTVQRKSLRRHIRVPGGSGLEGRIRGGDDMPKILIVDDSDINRELMGRILKRVGYSICCAADGAGGIAAAEQQRPDLILMDIAMGKMDGWEATQHIKANPATANIPIIALSAHFLDSDRKRSLEVGCAAFETKPVNIRRLLDRIEANLLLEARLSSCDSVALTD
jgi:CheY-like chemotaxis protein